MATAYQEATVELATTKATLASREQDIENLKSELEDTKNGALALAALVEEMKDQPLGRKIVPAEQFSVLAEKYPWLDSRIVAAIIRNEHPNS